MINTYQNVALIEVDVQNDFCPSGRLAVTNGDEVVKPLNSLHDWVRANSGINIATRDLHPEESRHFETWPKHCVAGTNGAEFHPLLNLKGSIIINKGTGAEDDAYSGFDGYTENGRDLKEILPSYGRLALIIGGLATDYCVKATVFDAVKLAGVDVFVPVDGVRAVNDEDGNRTLEEMRNRHVIICDSKAIVNGGLIKVSSRR